MTLDKLAFALDRLAVMTAKGFAHNDKRFDTLEKNVSSLNQDVKDIKRVLVFGRHEERITTLEKDVKETKTILQFK